MAAMRAVRVVRAVTERDTAVVRSAVVRGAAVLAVAGLGLTGCMSVGPGADERHGVVPVGQAGTPTRPGTTASASPSGAGHPGVAAGRSERAAGTQAQSAPAGGTNAAPGEAGGGVNGAAGAGGGNGGGGVNGAPAGIEPVPAAATGESAPGVTGGAGGANTSPAPR
ncbi:hypothetical protein ACFXAM_09545, partial [Kitasatospora sp. NPDC059462]